MQGAQVIGAWSQSVIVLSLVCAAGCVTHHHTLIGAVRPPLSPAEVQIYLEPLKAPYVEIALVEASSRFSWPITAAARIDTVLLRLQREAAALGANGILLQDLSGSDAGMGVELGSDVTRDHALFGIAMSGTGQPKVGRGTAIYIARP